MTRAPFLALFALGALPGCGSAPVPAATDDAPAVAAEVAPESPAPGGETVLEREADGHFYADVTVDGSTARMLVDTGASVVAIGGTDAASLGVSWEPEDIREVARGAGGAVYGVPVMLALVQLGDLEVSGVQAVVVPSLPVSLLGQSFLGRVGRIEVTGEEMVLGG